MAKYRRKDLPVRVPQTIQIGDDWNSITFVHYEPDGETTANLTGYTANMTIEFNDGTTEQPSIVMDAANGTYYATLPRANTANYSAQVATYELDLTDSADFKTTYFAGPVTIKSRID